jgi:hypothetical protein
MPKFMNVHRGMVDSPMRVHGGHEAGLAIQDEEAVDFKQA